MHNVNISNFRKDLLSYVSRALDYNDVISVSAKNGNVVVMNEEEYNGLMETLYLLGTPGMKEKLLDGAKKPGEKIDWRKELGK